MGTKGAGGVSGATGYEKTLRCWCIDGLLWRKIMSSTLPQRRAVTGALVLALCLLMLSGAASRAQAACGLGSFVPRQVIVKLDQGATITQINATYGSTVVEPFPGSTDIFLLGLPAQGFRCQRRRANLRRVRGPSTRPRARPLHHPGRRHHGSRR